MVTGLSFGRFLLRLIRGDAETRTQSGYQDIKIFDSTVLHTLRWYTIVGTIAVAVTPVLYTTMRIVAQKRKAFIIQTASSLTHPPTEINKIGGITPRSSLFWSERTFIALRHILDAQRATDLEFADLFATEIVSIYSDITLRGLLRSCCNDCIFHISIFVLCASLSRLNGIMVNSVEFNFSKEGLSGKTAMYGTIIKILSRAWWHLRRDALLQYPVKGVETPYAFFSFSQSSSRMLERWFPWFGVARFLSTRYIVPSIYLDYHWRIPEVADEVWRAMTPKGFAVVWCCRSLSGLLRPIYYEIRDRHNVVLYTPSENNNCTGGCNNTKTHNLDTEIGRNKYNKIDEKCMKKFWSKFNIFSSIYPVFVYIAHTGKAFIIIFAVTSYASNAKFSWLPFSCTGGPQYVALCYAEMVSIIWWGTFILLRRVVYHSLRQSQTQSSLRTI